MTNSKKITTVLGYILIALYSFIPQAQAAANVDLSNPAFAAAVGLTSIPIGHSEFCQSHSGECGMHSSIQDATALTQGRWSELLSVNAQANASIVGVSDDQLYQTVEFWTYPNGYGDCEDYVLAKRRDLIALGWHPSTLLITVVREPSGSGHAVLIARTDRGDLVLDNQEGLVKLWNQTPYQYIKRQSQSHAGQWVDISDTRPMTTIASL